MSGARYGLVGRRLGHSYSPFLHRELGGYEYGLFELEPERLESFIRSFGEGGLNVTIPYKKTVLPLCDRLCPRALETGSVNTLLIRNGEICGYNTDYDGFCYLLRQSGIEAHGKKALIFGSGGASATARRALLNMGAGPVITISRQGEDNYENLRRHADAGLLVNATPVGMFPDNGGLPADIEMFPRCGGVLDLIYNPLRTRLVLAAVEREIPAMGGLAMLAAQAAEAVGIFLGARPGGDRLARVLKKLRARAENIVLIGMPGCGKTGVGRALAELTGREFFDTDEMVSKLCGLGAGELIKRDGEEAFRVLESRAVRLAARASGAVIATGGGTPVREENMLSLRENGRVYFLSRGIELLDTRGRPLSVDLPELYGRRLPLYLRWAQARIENTASPGEAAEKIIKEHTDANTGY